MKVKRKHPKYGVQKKKIGSKKTRLGREETEKVSSAATGTKRVLTVGPSMGRPSVTVNIGKVRTRALLDSGSEVTLISGSFFRQIKNDPSVSVVRQNPLELFAANGSSLQNQGEVEIVFKITTKSFKRKFVVVPELGHSIIIGWDTMREENFILDAGAHTIHIGGTEYPTQCDEEMASLVRLAADCEIPAQSAAYVRARRARHTYHQDGTYEVSNAIKGVLQDEPGVWVANSLNAIEKGKCFGLQIVNETGRPVNLKKGNVVAQLEWLPDGFPIELGEPLVDPENLKYVESVGRKDGSAGKGPQTIDELLTRNKSLFAETDMDLGCTHLVSMKIDTGNHSPIACKPYRAPLLKRDFIEKKVEEMLQAGLIQESDSPWAAPVVIIDKKDGSKRFCVDYRRLNSVTTPSTYPLPLIDDILARLGGSKYFSTLDLKSGYHQLPMDPDSRDKTTFVVESGTYEFLVMPFGLSKAPATFSLLMSKVLKGLPFAAAYLDDIIIWSKTEEEHLLHLQTVFQRLESAGLKLKREKCHFFREKIEYLGHTVTPEGIRPCDDKVEAVWRLQPPTTVREVKGLIGFASYYRRYVPNFSRIVKPLTALTRKNKEFNWSRECQDALDQLKEILAKRPLLYHVNIAQPYILYTDASDVAVGATLVQEDEEGEHVVYYLSSALTPTQSRWPIIEREAWAIIFAIRKLKAYLYGAKFTVRTDHKPLEFLFKSEIKNVKVQKWAMELSELHCTIEYISGAKNVQADFMSRLPGSKVEVINTNKTKVRNLPTDTLDSQESGEDVLPTLISGEGPLEMVEEQEKDRNLKKLNGDIKYTRIEGVLYYIAEEPAPGLKLVIPRHLRKLVLEACHDNTGHMGIDKTYDRIRQNYHWKGIYRDVVHHVTSCVACNTRSLTQKRPPLQKMDDVSIPFEKLAIDTCGPYTTSHAGNKYLLTFVDMYSGWPEFYAIPDKSAQTVATVILEKIIPRHGCPAVLLSDNGTEFINAVVKEVCKVLNIYRVRTSPYHPQSNGKLERLHRVWNDIASKNMQDPRSWDEMIPSALLALRTAIHETSQYSPYYLMTGRDPMLPLDTLLRPRARYMGDEPHRQILENHHKAMVKVLQNSKRAFERSKRHYDRKVKGNDLKVGDPVYLFNTTRTSKLDSKWMPYYRILEQVTPVNFIIKNVVKGTTRKVHALHLRKANLEWKVPETPPDARNLRRAQLAAPLSTVDSSDTESYGNAEFIDSDDLPLARVRERMAQENLYDSDDLPLARVRDALREAEHPLPRPVDQGQNVVAGPPLPDSTDSVSMSQDSTDNMESEESATMDITTGEYGKRPRSDSPAIESESKRTRINTVKRKEKLGRKEKVKNLLELVASLI